MRHMFHVRPHFVGTGLTQGFAQPRFLLRVWHAGRSVAAMLLWLLIFDCGTITAIPYYFKRFLLQPSFARYIKLYVLCFDVLRAGLQGDFSHQA